jgi:aminoglycoside 2'-N-acetyltransferase I
MRVERHPGDEGWKEIQPLAALVYPPEVMASIVWRDVTWAHAAWWILVYGEDRLVSTAGLHLREGIHEGAPVRIGGIGGVMTHPALRRHGFAGAALRQAHAFFADQAMHFSLLFCEPKNIAFYAGLGWRAFSGEVVVEQPGTSGPFTLMTAMVRGVTAPAPSGGTIDLCGLPW